MGVMKLIQNIYDKDDIQLKNNSFFLDNKNKIFSFPLYTGRQLKLRTFSLI
jgi:hypothetical protein